MVLDHPLTHLWPFISEWITTQIVSIASFGNTHYFGPQLGPA